MRNKNPKLKFAIIIGTRPEIIKMAPVIREYQKRKLNFFILHTNQHYSENMDKIFFKELDLPLPKYSLSIGSGTHGEMTGRMLIEIEKVLLKEKPDVILIEGDTNTVLASALAAVKLQIKIAHIEAGLRSYFREMPEEINRILVDHCSDFLFAPTKEAKENLIKEGISRKKIFAVGNTIVDAIYQNLKLSSKKSKILNYLNLKNKEYFLVTVHRQENVDKKEKLKNILKGLELVWRKTNLPIIFPIHPRTKKRVKEFKLKIPKGIITIQPKGYLDFLNLEKNSRLILTDSGGIQEEACILKVPCVTLRENTERPETLKVKSNILVGTNHERILEGVIKMLKKKSNWKNLFGDGKSAKRIISI